MTKEEIKEQIIEIITEVSPDSITSDNIFARLSERIDPGRTQETIRGLIKQLVNNDNSLIGSSNKGYFLIKTDEAKLKKAIEYLEHRIPRLQQRAENLRRIWNAEHNSE